MNNNNHNNKNDDAFVATATRRAARGTLTTMGMRAVSFVGTQYCFRQLDATQLGQAHIQLELVLATILYLSREGFRWAVVTRPGSVDTVWLSALVATAVASAALVWHWYQCGATAPNNDQNDDYWTAGILYCVAAAVEGWAEPAVLIFLQTHQSVAEKATAEGLGAMTKTAVLVVLLSSSSTTSAVTSLGIAQCAYALTYAVVLYTALWRITTRTAKNPTTPDSVWPSSFPAMFHYETIRWIVVLTLQGLLKFALQEGDRIVLNVMSDSYHQGVYAMGSAYGGLAARLLLQPMEENARLLFGKLAHNNDNNNNATNSTTTTTNSSTSSDTTKPTTTTPVDNATTTTQQQQQQQQPTLDPRLEVAFTVLMKSVLYIGFVFSCLATNYTGLLLTVLAGPTWSQHVEAVQVLSAFCIYTACLAANGLAEAFVSSVTATTQHVQQVSAAHFVAGLVFAVTAPAAIRHWGTVGLVWANGVSMLGRSVFAIHFAARYLAADRRESSSSTTSTILRRMLPRMLPAPMVGMAFGLAYLATRASRDRMMTQQQQLLLTRSLEDELFFVARGWWRLAVEHVAVGVTVGVGILTLAYTVEREYRQQIRTLWHGKQD